MIVAKKASICSFVVGWIFMLWLYMIRNISNELNTITRLWMKNIRYRY